MAQPRLPQLYVECRITHQQAEPSRVDVHEPEAPELGFELRNAAGATFHETEAVRGLSWTINQEEPSRLHLRSFSTAAQPPRQDITLAFAQALLPHVATDTSHVYAITSGGLLHSIQLPEALHTAAATEEQRTEVSPAFTPLTAEFQRLGAPTVLLLVGPHICIGTQSGTVLAVPKASAQRGSADFAVELKPPGGVGRLLTSFFARASTAAVTCMAAVELAGHILLAAAYSDASLRLWDLSRQTCLLHSPLVPGGAQEGAALPTHMAFAPPPADEPGRPGKVVVQLDEPDQDAAASRFVAFELYGTPGTMSSLSGVDMQQVSVLEPLSGKPLAQGRVKSMAAQQRTGGKVRAWVLDADGVPSALDDSPISRGLKGAVVQLDTHDIESMAQSPNPTLQEELWGQTVAALEGSSGRKVPEDLVLSTLADRLVSSGSLSLPALRAALSAAGQSVSLQELRQMASADLKHCIARALSEAAAAQGTFAAVQKLYRDYLEAERTHSAVMALCLPPGVAHAAPLLIRRGPALSCLQPAEPVTALVQNACAPEHHPSSQAMQRIAAASNLIRDLIGPFCSTLAVTLLERGFDLGREVLPAMMHALAAGPGSAVPSQGSRSASASSEGVRSQWRRQRSKLALNVGTLLGEHVQHLDEALSGYASLLDGSSPAVGPASTATPTPAPDNRTLAAAAGQAAASRSQAAASLLMLLAYIGTTRSLGILVVSNSHLQHIQQSVVPAVEAALRQAEIVRWLASSPAQHTEAPGRDPSALLHRLQLGQASAPMPAGHQAQEKSLAEALLASRSSPGREASVTIPWGACAEDILLGIHSEGASMTDEDAADLSAKVAHLGMQLLEAKQVAGLLPVLRLAGSVSEEPHLQFLKGYAALDQLRSASGSADRAAWLDTALGPLFRAAAALDTDSSAGSHSSLTHMRSLLYWLWKDATAAAFEEEGPKGQQLQYFEALMLVCERLGCPEGAAQFAQAAVHQVDAAYSGEGGDESAQRAREGRLWTNLFVYYLEAGRMEAAYAAMQATPVPERQLESLQRLLGELCARGDIATLVQLPLSGIIQLDRNGRAEVHSVGDEALSYLRRRADLSDLAAAPQPYQVLYSFCVSQSCFREAAAAQLAYARRLRDETPQQLDLIISALSAASNALSLVEPAHAWLEDPAGPDAAPAQRAFLGSSLPEGSYLPAAQDNASPRSPLPEAGQQDALDGDAPGAVHHVTPGALMKEVAKVHAMRSAGMHDFDAAKPMDLIHLLLGQKQIDAAWQLASSVLEGAALGKALDYTIRALAEACVHAQHEEGARPASTSGTQGSAASWQSLRGRLSDAACGASAGVLRIAAVDAILSADRRMSLPAWLLAPFQVQDASKGMAGSQADPAALLRVLMKHGRVEQAAALALQYLKAWQTEVLDSERQRHAAVWFPHDLLRDLVSRLGGDRPQTGDASRLQRELDSAIQRHRQTVEEQSSRLQQQSMVY